MTRVSPNRMDAYVWLWTHLLLGNHPTPLRLV
jgi:phage terminase large subunit-like protein